MFRWYLRFSIEIIWLSTYRFDSDDPADDASFLELPSQSKRWHSYEMSITPPALPWGAAALTSVGLVRLTMLLR
jgi:hypothetical protein